MKESGKKLSGALRKDPKNKPMQRLSPGVYRSASGGLVGQGGRQIQRQRQAPPQSIPPQNSPMPTDPVFFNPEMQVGQQIQRQPQLNVSPESAVQDSQMNPGRQVQQGMYWAPGFGPDQTNMPMDKMYRWPQASQMPQPSANMGGQYRLSPGVYGNQQQAMNQYNQQMQQMYQPMTMPQVRKG
jgi:hypothetical protein